MTEQEQIKAYLLSQIIYGKKDIAPDQQLIDTGLIDSIQIVKVIIYLEEQFSIQFVEEDIVPENFDTLEQIAELVRSKICSNG